MSVNSVQSFTGEQQPQQEKIKPMNFGIPLGLTGLGVGLFSGKIPGLKNLVQDKVEFSNATLENLKKAAENKNLTAEQQGIIKEGIALLEGSPAAATTTATGTAAAQSGIKALTEQEMKTLLSTELSSRGFNGNLDRVRVSQLLRGRSLDQFTTQILNPGAIDVANANTTLTHNRVLDQMAQEEVTNLQRRLSAIMTYNPANDVNTLLRQAQEDHTYITDPANAAAPDLQLRTNRYNTYRDAHNARLTELGNLGTYGANGNGTGRIGELQTRLAAARNIEGMDVGQLEGELSSALERRWALLNETQLNPALQSMIGDAEREAVRLDREAASARAKAVAKRAEANAINDVAARGPVEAEATRLEQIAGASELQATRANAVVTHLADPNALVNNAAINGVTGVEATARTTRTAAAGNVTNAERALKNHTQNQAVNETCAELAEQAAKEGKGEILKETASKAITEKVNSKIGGIVQDAATAAKDGKTSVVEALKKLPEAFKGKWEKICEVVKENSKTKVGIAAAALTILGFGIGSMLTPKEST